jgi:hypothetical protein
LKFAAGRKAKPFALVAASVGHDNLSLKSGGAGFAGWKQAKRFRPHKLRAKY